MPRAAALLVPLILSLALTGYRTSLQDQPQTPRANSARPNIVLAIADDWSFPHASAYGDRAVRTPNFDRVAREGVRFTHARAYPVVSACHYL
ncbi:MAG: sulfatase-like hydrolase/transferase [Hyphomicrobiaceae bacterium]